MLFIEISIYLSIFITLSNFKSVSHSQYLFIYSITQLHMLSPSLVYFTPNFSRCIALPAIYLLLANKPAAYIYRNMSRNIWFLDLRCSWILSLVATFEFPSSRHKHNRNSYLISCYNALPKQSTHTHPHTRPVCCCSGPGRIPKTPLETPAQHVVWSYKKWSWSRATFSF